MIDCPVTTDCMMVCEQQLRSAACQPEKRVTIACFGDLGTAGLVCNASAGLVEVRPGYCVPEQAALGACLQGGRDAAAGT
jgi:hypothetical protein